MKFAVLLALSLGIAAPALADPIIVPSETCKAYFFVPVTLPARDDRPDDRTLWFLYDMSIRTRLSAFRACASARGNGRALMTRRLAS